MPLIADPVVILLPRGDAILLANTLDRARRDIRRRLDERSHSDSGGRQVRAGLAALDRLALQVHVALAAPRPVSR